MAEATSVAVLVCGPRGLLPQPRKAGEGHRSVSSLRAATSMGACEMPWESSALPLPQWVTEQKACAVGTAHLSPSETPKRPWALPEQHLRGKQRLRDGKQSPESELGLGAKLASPASPLAPPLPRLQIRALTGPASRAERACACTWDALGKHLLRRFVPWPPAKLISSRKSGFHGRETEMAPGILSWRAGKERLTPTPRLCCHLVAASSRDAPDALLTTFNPQLHNQQPPRQSLQNREGFYCARRCVMQRGTGPARGR